MACGLMGYAQSRSLDCFEYLCDSYEHLPDSSRTQITWKFGSPLITIVEGCNWAAIRIIKKHRDFMNSFVDEPFGENGNTPMLTAVQENCIEVAKWLINQPGKKPDIEKRNVKGESPIYLAAQKGQVEVVKEMLEICT
jgi:ankyrin repeat protein